MLECRLKRASFAQLGAVALALVFVVGAGGYGITRGLPRSSTSPCDRPTDGFNIIQREVTTGERSQLWLVEYERPSEEPGTSSIIT